MRPVLQLLVLFLYFLVCPKAQAQRITISIFNEIQVKSLVVSSLSGDYLIYTDDLQSFDLNKEAIYISLFKDRILLRNSQKAIGTFSNIRFECKDTSGILKIILIDPSSEVRLLDEDLLLSVQYGRILLRNELTPDNYIAGVVEAEAGSKAEPEFYKAQSILARTYLYGHINRHTSEGFNLCDGVHCQAFKGRPTHNPSIRSCTKATSGLVVIDKDSAFVTAVFHANCGGETESSENAWLNNKNYLQPLKDPFCANSPSFRWTKTIPLEQWKLFLKGQGFKFPAGSSPDVFNFTQENRKKFYRVNRDSIPLRQLRTYFQLRSTFFSVHADKESIVLKGRGFGHGVGLCQDGAMQMAKVGYSCEEILNFYYKNINIVKFQP